MSLQFWNLTAAVQQQTATTKTKYWKVHLSKKWNKDHYKDLAINNLSNHQRKLQAISLAKPGQGEAFQFDNKHL